MLACASLHAELQVLASLLLAAQVYFMWVAYSHAVKPAGLMVNLCTSLCLGFGSAPVKPAAMCSVKVMSSATAVVPSSQALTNIHGCAHSLLAPFVALVLVVVFEGGGVRLHPSGWGCHVEWSGA